MKPIVFHSRCGLNMSLKVCRSQRKETLTNETSKGDLLKLRSSWLWSRRRGGSRRLLVFVNLNECKLFSFWKFIMLKFFFVISRRWMYVYIIRELFDKYMYTYMWRYRYTHTYECLITLNIYHYLYLHTYIYIYTHSYTYTHAWCGVYVKYMRAHVVWWNAFCTRCFGWIYSKSPISLPAIQLVTNWTLEIYGCFQN